MSSSDAISPTAHYTGQVWLRNGLSHPLLGTREGRLLFDSLQPLMRTSTLLGGPSLEPYLLARHHAIDARLEHAIEHDGVTQVLEVATGMSPRGWRFASRYGERLTYVEADLPAMAARKRRALERIGSLSAAHRVVDLDALRDRGPLSLQAVAGELDPARGLAIITEGLLGYLAPDDMTGLWRRFARTLDGFAGGATCLTCTSAASRVRPCAAFASPCRRSCAAASICTSRAPRKRWRRCWRPDSRRRR